VTDARFDGLAREVLITTVPAANIAGLVREVLVINPTAVYFTGVVREVLGQFPVIPTSVRFDGLVREVLGQFPVSVPPDGGGTFIPGLPAVQRPISIRNRLTNEVRGYNAVQDVVGNNVYFNFGRSGFSPSSYEVRNFSPDPLPIILAGKIYILGSGTIWTFDVSVELDDVVGLPYPRLDGV